jgi:hypothetical protein
MRVVILNWSGGENDPFTFFSEQLALRLNALGHQTLIMPLSPTTGQALAEMHVRVGVDLAVTWQGIGSAMAPEGQRETIWEALRIPLLCLHGDHPCYNPANHQQGSPYLLHIYPSASFANAANRLIPRQWPGVVVETPNWFARLDEPLQFEGDYFVFPKNIQHLDSIREDWKTRVDPSVRDLLMRMATQIEAAYRAGNLVNHHEVILDELPHDLAKVVRAGQANREISDVVFTLSGELDRVHRNVAAAFVLDTLTDTPIRIYGRGWERHQAKQNPLHEFYPASKLEDSRFQFSSAYGILDVAPSNDTLHDRTLRAVTFGAGLLISSGWRREEPIHREHAGLFFNGNPDELRARVAAVRDDPAAHRERVREFGNALESAFSFDQFFDRVLSLFRDRGITV